MCGSSKRVVTAEGQSLLRDIPNGAHRQWDLLGHVHRVCRRVWSARFFRGSYTPSASDRWAVEGVHGNYYAITHKPIDLDWTPGGRAARSRARSDLLQDQVLGVVHSARLLRPQDGPVSLDFFVSAFIREED